MFKYGFQTMVQSQFVDNVLYINGETASDITVDIFEFEVIFYLMF